MTDSTRSAWTRFWTDGRGRSCADRSATIQTLLGELWRQFARSLPRGARVLDLATGNGTVAVQLRDCRADLKIMGVDASPILPPEPRGVKLKAGVPLEEMPFRTGQFDALTSQFGFEYSDTKASAKEVARVLRPGGHFQFILHHREGALVRHNMARREALIWAARDSGLIDRAKAAATAVALGLPVPPPFQTAQAEAKARFPGQGGAAEIALAVAQTLALGHRRPAGETIAALDRIAQLAEGEIERLTALQSAAADGKGILRHARHLAGEQLQLGAPEPLAVPGEAPFAWILAGRKP